MMLEDLVARRAVDVVRKGDFFRMAHGLIYAAIAQLLEDGVAVDFITLRNAMEAAGTLGEAGGPQYLAALPDGMPKSSNWQHYASIVREMKRHRDLIFVANKILAEAYEHGVSSQVVADHGDRWLQELRQDAFSENLTSPAEATADFFDHFHRQLERFQTDPTALLGRSTGFPTLDEHTSGMGPGELILLAADTGRGKTSMALQIALAVAKAGDTAVFYVSPEMQRLELQNRIAAVETEVPLTRIRNGWCQPHEVRRVKAAMAEVSQLRLFIDEATSTTVAQVRAKARRLAAEHPLGLVVIDYIQLLTAEDQQEHNRTEQLSTMSRGLKLLARELGIPVLVLSQFSRRDAGAKQRRPQLSDLKGSSSLEQDADMVWFIYSDLESPLEAELIVGKNRNGPEAVMKMVFDKAMTKFRDTLAEDRAKRAPIQETMARVIAG
jgi:replicative DNA helicase